MTIWARENGMTKAPKVRSAKASEATNQFCAFCKVNSEKIAMMTSLKIESAA